MKVRRKQVAKEAEYCWPNLPDDVLMEILCRLPIKTLISLKSVCKLWLNLISSDTHFADFHHQRAPTEILLGSFKKLHLGSFQFHKPSVSDFKHTLLFNLPNFFPLSKPVFTNSCNGFVCFTYSSTSYYNLAPVICNPVTGEFISAPDSEFGNFIEACGLGFSGKENRYKLFRARINSRKGFAEIFTFEKGSSWRNLGNFPFSGNLGKNSSFSWPLVYLENKLHFHWCRRDMDRGHAYIDCFDFDTEQFGEVPLPPLYDYDRVSCVIVGNIKLMGELESSLSISHSGINSSFDVWVMKNYGVADSWTKAFSITARVSRHRIKPRLRVPFLQLGNGDIVMYGKDDCLVLYNPVLNQPWRLGFGSKFRDVFAYKPTLLPLLDALAGYEACVQNLNSR